MTASSVRDRCHKDRAVLRRQPPPALLGWLLSASASPGVRGISRGALTTRAPHHHAPGATPATQLTWDVCRHPLRHGGGRPDTSNVQHGAVPEPGGAGQRQRQAQVHRAREHRRAHAAARRVRLSCLLLPSDGPPNCCYRTACCYPLPRGGHGPPACSYRPSPCCRAEGAVLPPAPTSSALPLSKLLALP